MTARLYTSAEAAEMLGLNIKSLDSQVRRYGLRAVEGRSIATYRFTLEDIQARIAKREQNEIARRQWNGCGPKAPRQMQATALAMHNARRDAKRFRKLWCLRCAHGIH